MKRALNYGIVYWSKVAMMTTNRAAHVKDYKLTRKIDREFKRVAKELMLGRGYIIATAFELEQKYPDLFNAGGVDSPKMIWAVSFFERRIGNKMCFAPVR